MQSRDEGSSKKTSTLSEFLVKPWNRTNSATIFEFSARLIEGGTNALPELLKMLTAEDSVLTKAKMKINSAGFIKIGGFIPADEIRSRAIRGFGILRRTAGPAIPVLTNMIERSEAAESAVDALCAIRDEAVTALIQVLRSNSDPNLRRYTLHAIEKSGFSRKERYRMFFEALDDPEPVVRSNALFSLHGLLSSSGASVPSSNAITKISKQLSDPNESVRFLATQAVERIAELQKGDKPRVYRYE